MQEEQDSHYVLTIGESESNYKHITESSDGFGSRHGTEEEEDDDDLLKEDINNWDIFDDCHKF